MIGAIIGDVVGSVYEWHNVKSMDFPMFTRDSFFTDDSVMTVAVADAILRGGEVGNRPQVFSKGKRYNYAAKFREYGRRYPDAGYGSMFLKWIYMDKPKPYNSYGNGSAMRVSPVGFAFNTLEEVLAEAKNTSIVTHNHKEGIKGAQATAAAVFLARMGETKSAIKKYIETTFKYDLDRRLDDIRSSYTFNETCQGTVPQSIVAFLESEDFEDAIRKAISIGGDSDTVACITGGIAHAYYKKIPRYMIDRTNLILDTSLKKIVADFNHRYLVL